MNPAAGSRGNLLCSCSRPPEIIVASLMRQIYYYRLGSIAARLGCYAVRAGLKLRAAVALPPIFTSISRRTFTPAPRKSSPRSARCTRRTSASARISTPSAARGRRNLPPAPSKATAKSNEVFRFACKKCQFKVQSTYHRFL